MAQIWGAGGGRSPPAPPCFPGGSAPRTPKRRSAPLAATVVRFLATEPLVRGSFAAWGRTSSQKSDFFFEQATCPRQLRCLGQNFFSKIRVFLNKPLVPGSFAAWGRTVSRKSDLFLKKPLVPGSFACLGQNFSQKSDLFLNKPLVPGSFAAWGRTFSQNMSFF